MIYLPLITQVQISQQKHLHLFLLFKRGIIAIRLKMGFKDVPQGQVFNLRKVEKNSDRYGSKKIDLNHFYWFKK